MQAEDECQEQKGADEFSAYREIIRPRVNTLDKRDKLEQSVAPEHLSAKQTRRQPRITSCLNHRVLCIHYNQSMHTHKLKNIDFCKHRSKTADICCWKEVFGNLSETPRLVVMVSRGRIIHLI